ncbi:MAG: hypothetical protein DWQ30_18765 [Acidobacteria bacterium]|nr:MAG: hypothetical protein DWQ30_18765 [Acidobacteriota bacterium]
MVPEPEATAPTPASARHPVLVCAALRGELTPWLRALRDRRSLHCGPALLGLVEGRLATRLLHVAWFGVGASRAAAAAEELAGRLCGRTTERAQRVPADAAGAPTVYLVGLAGGLDPALRVGETVWIDGIDRIDDLDAMDRSGPRGLRSHGDRIDGVELLEESGRNDEPGRGVAVGLAATGAPAPSMLRAAAPLRGRADGRLATLTGPRPLASAAEKARLWDALERPLRALVDMESHPFVDRLTAAGERVAVLRAVSDVADESLPAVLAAGFGPGGLDAGRIARSAVLRPHSWSSLARLSSRLRRGAAALAAALHAELGVDP